MKQRKIAGIILLWYVVRYLCENVLFAFGWGILLFRCIYHPLCLSTAYRQVRRHYPTGRDVLVRYSLFLTIYALCYAFYLPDRIDFFIDKVTVLEKMLKKEKKMYDSWNESDDFTIVATCYWSDYPDRIPFIADRKMVVYGAYKNIWKAYGTCPECKLVHMYGNWYYWYYENNEMPG